ncbi:MAG: copper resistance CopC family protein [Candidatus Rokuibacteriota bacterium]
MVDGTRRALIGLLALALLAPIDAAAHAYLVKSVPTRRAAVLRAPARVQLWFNERIEPAFSRLAVWDAAGAQVDSKDARVSAEDPRELSVGLPPLAAGAYIVRFRVLSVDGHVVESEFPFTVRTGS